MTTLVEAHNQPLAIARRTSSYRSSASKKLAYVAFEGRTVVVANIPKVLIVDDERTIADTLALILSINGYETGTAYSAEQAIEIVSQWLPDVATIDVVFPGMNGIDLAILLTAQCPASRLLLSSGQGIEVARVVRTVFAFSLVEVLVLVFAFRLPWVLAGGGSIPDRA